jgi:sugar (pentulose or hexulose) kinase
MRLVTGTTDSNAATLAAGATRAGDGVTSLGSTLVLKILSNREINAPEYGIYSHRLGDQWLVGGASNSGGAVAAAYFTQEQIRFMSQGLDPDRPTGLDYYPLLQTGERFPVNDPDYPPRLTPRPKNDMEFFQGILEGIAQIEKQGYQLLHQLGAPAPTRVISIGGGAVNEPWRLMRERLLGVPVSRAAHAQAAYGTALLALQACG